MEWRASHILVKDRSGAEDLLKRLKQGAQFESLAREFSTCPSKSSGGDLGWFGRGKMVKPFEDAAFSLKPGQISDPVKTQFGYHIIRVDKVEFKSFEEAKPEMENTLKPQMVKKQIDELKNGSTVKLDEAFFGPLMPAPGTASAGPAPQVTVQQVGK